MSIQEGLYQCQQNKAVHFFLLDICQIHFTILICTINIKCLQKRGRKYLVQPFNNLMLEYTWFYSHESE